MPGARPQDQSAHGSGTGTQPRVAVAVVSWNTRDLLARCLESLRPDARRGLAEVWVVDNASQDGSADMVRERFPWAHLVASEQNLGFGRAVNLVAARTSSEWVAAANADIALRPGALDALIAAGSADPGAGAIAPRLVLPDGRTQHSVFAFPTVAFALVFATGLFRLSRELADRYAIPGWWDSERARRVPWAIGAFLLVRREAWDAVGGFDERQWMYAEDLDLGWRLREAGWATRFEPRAQLDHQSSASVTQLFGDDLESRWQRSTYGFLARRRGVAIACAVALIQTLGAAGRWAWAAPLAALHAERAAERAAYRRWALLHARALRRPRALRDVR